MITTRGGNTLSKVPFGKTADTPSVPSGLTKGMNLVKVEKGDVNSHVRRALHIDIKARKHESLVKAMTAPEEST
jgi:hypothetical protein